jgi:hypothetical protein
MCEIRTVFAALCLGSVLLATGCNKPDEGSPAAGGAAAQTPAGDPTAAPVLPTLDAQTLAERLGTALSPSEGGSLRAIIPRADVKVSVDGAPFPAAAGLGTEVVFHPSVSGATLVGSASLFQDEVSPAMDSAFAHGMAVTALHGRFFFDEPRVVSMHFVAEGNAAFLASGVQAIGSAIRDARAQSALPRSNFGGDPPLPGSLNAPALGAVFGVQASSREGLVKINVQGDATRRSTLSSEAPLLWAVFFGSDQRAAVDGGFTLSPHHVQLVLQALRRTNIHVVSVQQHGMGHEPGHSLVYFHANGSALALAQGIHAALQARLSKGGQ